MKVQCNLIARCRGHAIVFTLLTLLSLFLGALSNQAQSVLYSVTVLGTLPGGTFSRATAINNSGEVVGFASIDDHGDTRAFCYSNGIMTDLGMLPGSTSSYAEGINSAGQIAGYTVDTNGNFHAFLYSNGAMTDLGVLTNSQNSMATGINSGGQVVGYAWTSSIFKHGFLYTSGAMVDLGALNPAASAAYGINDDGQIVGYSAVNSNGLEQAVLFSGGTITNLGGLVAGQSSCANAINHGGQVVGYAVGSNGIVHPFRYDHGQMTDLGMPPGASACQATGINASGQVVGFANAASSLVFLYAGGTMTDVSQLIPSTYSSWTLDGIPAGINDSGQIACTGFNGLADLALLLTPVSVKIIAADIMSSNVVLSCSTAVDFLHDVQSTTNLISAPWSTVVSNVMGSGVVMNYTNVGGVPVSPKFYRIVVHQ
jgi:probable HAF family extracellular repeat protein